MPESEGRSVTRRRPGRFAHGLSDARLLELRDDLESGRDLSPAVRGEISEALGCLRVLTLLEEVRSGRRRPGKAFDTHWAVLAAAALVTRFGVHDKTAIAAVVADREWNAERVARAYRKWKRARRVVCVVPVNDAQIAAAVARLTPHEIERGAKRLRRESGKIQHRILPPIVRD
jgi:hypothetical protein